MALSVIDRYYAFEPKVYLTGGIDLQTKKVRINISVRDLSGYFLEMVSNIEGNVIEMQ
jgi:hypothetical protein